jgi:hypothetical protein
MINQEEIFPKININKGDIEFVKGPKHPDRKRTKLPEIGRCDEKT